MRGTGGIVLLAVSSVLGAPIESQGPHPLSFDDLIALAASNPASPEGEARLDALLSQPFVSNRQAPGDATSELRDPPSGKTLRIAEWNINREDNESMTLAFSDWRAFETLTQKNPHLHARGRRRARFLNYAPVERISDHSPTIVNLDFATP